MLTLGVRSERPAKQPLFELQSDCFRLQWRTMAYNAVRLLSATMAYNSAPSDRSERSYNFWDCNLGHLECSRSAVPVFGSASSGIWECNGMLRE